VIAEAVIHARHWDVKSNSTSIANAESSASLSVAPRCSAPKVACAAVH
jgi:hypothetical protein